MEANRKFVHPGALAPLPKYPKKQFAIFTCMDTRLVEFMEPAMGVKRGDAKVIKTAGNTIVDPINGSAMRSLVAGIFTLNVDEVFVVGHEDCGMSAVEPEKVKHAMIKRGISPEAIDKYAPDLVKWLGAFNCPEDNVIDVVGKIRKHPLIPKNVPVHGLIFSPNDGHLTILVNGYEAEGFEK